MKKSLIILTALTLVLSAVGTQAQFRVEFTPTVTDMYAVDFLASGSPVTVNIYHTNTQMRTGWSTPFVFYGTGTVNLTGPGTHSCDPGFCPVWTMGQFTAEESWDGDLTTGNSYMNGEHWNYSGLTLSGYMPGPEMLAFTFTFNLDEDDDGDVQTIEGEFCVDSGDFDDNTYDWLFDPPEPFGGPYCTSVKMCCAILIEISNCIPTDVSMQWDEQFAYQFEVTDIEGLGDITWNVIDGPGNIDNNGVYTYNPNCSDVGSHTVTVEACSDMSICAECTFSVTVLNTAPVIGGDCGEEFKIGTDSYEAGLLEFTATDANVGDVMTWSVGGISPDDGNLIITPVGNGIFDVQSFGVAGTYTVTICVEDCAGIMVCCDVTITTVLALPFDIVIEKTHDTFQGHFEYVSITVENSDLEMGGFDFLIAYDASALAFMEATPGQLLEDCGWEYFTYRHGVMGNCGDACPEGLLRIIAMAETNDGDNHPSCYGAPDTDPHELVEMKFYVTNDRTFECQYVPIKFFWTDCGDNTISSVTGDTLFVSDHVYEFEGTEITDPTFGFPTYFGIQAECLENPDPNKPDPLPFINFYNGGIDIICAEDIDDRGDINLNGVVNEIADATVFVNYFIYGLAAFVINVEGQIAATDVNADGMVLTVGDLVYLIRIIVGDALPYPKETPVTELKVAAGNSIVMNAEIGAAALVFDGQAEIALGKDALGMELLVGEVDGNTHALIYSMNRGVSAYGEILIIDGNLVSIDAADYAGNAYKTAIIPADFALKQNYPNPFNPNTVIELSLPVASEYTLTIYNIAGQRVYLESGYGEAGTISFNVNLEDFASGIYFYKANAGNFSATKKMILLK